MTSPATQPSPAEELAHIKWFHSMELGHGLVTKGVINVGRSLRQYQLPKDLTGKTFLDIGAWDGAFSFEAERRGASRVLATDWFIWKGMGWGSKEGFEIARRELHQVRALVESPKHVGLLDVARVDHVEVTWESPNGERGFRIVS